MFIGRQTDDSSAARPGDDDDSDWEAPAATGPSLSEADDQFIDLLVGESDDETEQEDESNFSSDSSSVPSAAERSHTDGEFLSLGELATGHLAQATMFLGRSVRRVSGTITHYPSAMLVQTRQRASSIIEDTMQQTKALSHTILDLTVHRAMKISTDALVTANEATHAAINTASRAISPPRVVQENGEVKHLPEALAEQIACNPPELHRLVLRANEVCGVVW